MDAFCGRLNADYYNLPEDHFCKIDLQFDTYSCDVYYTIRDDLLLRELQIIPVDAKAVASEQAMPTNDELVRVNAILMKDPLMSLDEDEKALIVKSRDYLKEIPNTLTYYLCSVRWYSRLTRTNPDQLSSAVAAIDNWHSSKGFAQWVILLDSRFHNEHIRAKAVQKLESMSDSEL